MKVKEIGIEDKMFPPFLKLISDPPKKLFCIGNIELMHTTCIATVGARKCTEYGKNVALSLGRRLGENGITVVSGLAKGIDTFCHKGTLEVDGSTIAVLGCGIDLCYPSQNQSLKEEICNKGLVISEYPEGFKPMPYTFPRRNRIISGLSVSTVVVEASNKSGSLITAEEAMNQGRNVYAVPGNITSHYSFGSNKLIRDGAMPLVVLDDILTDIGINPKIDDEISNNMGEDERKIYEVIRQCGEMSVEEIHHKTNIKLSVINGIITVLEMKGIIFSSLGKVFIAKF